MRETSVHSISDQEFVREVGIVADLRPRAFLWRKLLLAVAVLVAAFATFFGGLFATGTVTASNNFQSATTQCPMTGNTSKPAR